MVDPLKGKEKLADSEMDRNGRNDKSEFPENINRQNEQIQKIRNVNNFQITKRELEVLQLLSNGDSSKIIADKLYISETTAITHRKNLIQKLRVKNTAHLIKIAVLARIIE